MERMESGPLIEARGLTVRAGDAVLLDGVDLRIAPGEIVTIVGPNGAGKTTLLRALVGIQPLAGGEIRRAPGLRIGYVLQRLALDRNMPITAARFVALAQEVGPGEVQAALARVGAEGLGGRQLNALSGGQLQRVLLARAILRRPHLLLLDEPTAGLDQPGIAAFYRLIAALREEMGVAVLLVSHDLHVVMSASDRVICLNRHVCCAGAPRAVAEAPEYRALFGTGTQGMLGLYRHAHDHRHDGPDDHPPRSAQVHAGAGSGQVPAREEAK